MTIKRPTISRCTICNKPFAGPRLAIVGKGMDLKNNRIAQFTEKLTRHLFDEHPAEAQQIMMNAAEYQGVLILATFQTDDADMREQMDLVRWKVHQKTLACRYSRIEATEQTLFIISGTANGADAEARKVAGGKG